MRHIDIILGLQYGDEGKGSIVNSQVGKRNDPLVIRFSGGSQCSHTVIHNKKRHVFSTIGSGALQGAPTYISKYCAINPIALMNEVEILGFIPKIYIDAETMITTPWDIMIDAHENQNDTTGQGVGRTIGREEANYHFYARDLKCSFVTLRKLAALSKWYGTQCDLKISPERMLEFMRAMDFIVKDCIIVRNFQEIPQFHDIVFEGSQGIMLDQQYGFFPYVTRANTTSQNAWKILAKSGLNDYLASTYYVMRAYCTRHGAGPYPYSGIDVSEHIKSNPDETNITNDYQGRFFRSYHRLPSLAYALDCDDYHRKSGLKKLVITCLDQTNDMLLIDQKLVALEDLDQDLIGKVDMVTYSRSPEGL